jgi:hypothetical protein
MPKRIAMIMLMLSIPIAAHARELGPLAIGAAPPCSKQNGIREFHSSVVQDGSVSAFLVGTARRDSSGCQQNTEIRIETADVIKSSPLPSKAEDVEIVDFSPDGSKLFLADDEFEGVRIAAMPIASGELRWKNISELLGWKDCGATVQPLGFTVDGKLSVRAAPSVLSSPPHPNCVSEEHLYAFDEHWKPATLTTDAAIQHFGKKTRPAFQPCQSDPDVTGECFNVHGRLSAKNGNPTFRIWRIGTRRVVGITDRLYPSEDVVMPEPLAGKMGWDVEAWGDFFVCPFTDDKSGLMRMVCIESAGNVTFKHRELGANFAAKP